MSCTSPITTLLIALLVAGAGSIGCGGEDERPRIERSRLGEAQPVAERSEERMLAERTKGEAVIEDLVVWPEGAGEPRSVRADYRDCLSALEGEADVRGAHPLVEIKWLLDCMTSKGWAMHPDSGIPQS